MHARHAEAPPFRQGSLPYRRAVLGMLAAGLACFNTLYITQGILTTLSAEFQVSPTVASISVTVTTGMLAVCIVPISVLSGSIGRRRTLIICALLATTLGVLLPFCTNMALLIAIRALQGAVIAGVPAVAMTWLQEHIHPADLPQAMGTYIAGTTIGGLSGRFIPAFGMELFSWRGALGMSVAFTLIMALLLTLILPRTTATTTAPSPLGSVRDQRRLLLETCTDPKLVALFFTAFAGLGIFVSLYNFMGFRLMTQFGFGQAQIGAVFLLYLCGTWSSSQAGQCVSLLGRARTMLVGCLGMLLGLCVMVPPFLWSSLLGLALLTTGFFLVHAVASGWVGVLGKQPAAASSMYLMSYYVGSSVLGLVSGLIFDHLGWTLLILWLFTLSLLITAVAIWLRAVAAPDRN